MFRLSTKFPTSKSKWQERLKLRQLFCYNKSIVKDPSTRVLNLEIVSTYTWTENGGKKSSNEIASIIANEFSAWSEELKTCSSILLVYNSCLGQNNNVNVLTALMVWLSKGSRQYHIEWFLYFLLLITPSWLLIVSFNILKKI